VVSPHGMLEPWAFRHKFWKKLPYLWMFERRFLTRASSLFVTSRLEAEHVARLVRHPDMKVLPLGCRDCKHTSYESARALLGWLPHQRVIVFLSRIHRKKGLDLLMRALASTSVSWQGWRFVIVGDGDANYVQSLKELANTLTR